MTARKIKGKRGGQPGNQNARKHGYYSKALTPQEQAFLSDAGAVSGIDREINLARVKLKGILVRDPYNFPVLFRSIGAVSKMVGKQDTIRRGVRREVSEASKELDRFLAGSTRENGSRSD